MVHTNALHSLRQHPQLLAKLREKLAVLWGNLQEVKTPAEDDEIPWADSVSNLPFDCCIREYGEKVENEEDAAALRAELGWIRLHRLFGTTIL